MHVHRRIKPERNWERIGLSQMHVSRLQRTAIKKLQQAAKQ